MDYAPPVPTNIPLPAFSRRQGPEGACLYRKVEVKHFQGGLEAIRADAARNEGRGGVAWLEAGWRSVREGNSLVYEQWLLAEGGLTRAGKERLADYVAKLGTQWEPTALPPDWEAKLLPWQIMPARRNAHGLRTFRGVWDTSDMGTGKTYQSLAAALTVAQETGKRVGVICPKSVIPPWLKAFRHFGERPDFVLNYNTARNGKLPKSYRPYGSGEWLAHQCPTEMKHGAVSFRNPEKLILIFDEAHTCKNGGTKNAALLLAAMDQGIQIICASGTIANNPMEMRATGMVVGLHAGTDTDFHSFICRHGCRQGYDGQFYFADRSKLAVIHSKVFGTKEHSCRGSRVKISDLGDAFPETQIICEVYDTGKASEINALFAKKIASQTDDDELEQQLTRGACMKIKRQIETLKVPGAIALAKQEYEAGRSVAIFCNFTDVREMAASELASMMGKDFSQDCQIHGTQNGPQRQRAIDLFQSGKSRGIVCNLSAGGVGVSLHDEAGEYPRTAIIFPSDRAVDVRQGLGRVHRAGGKSRSRQIVYFAADTLEEDIMERLRAKMANFDTLNDGDLNPAQLF